MKKMMTLIFATAFGSVGWALGRHIGFVTAYMFSCVGSGVGIYTGIRFTKRYLG